MLILRSQSARPRFKPAQTVGGRAEGLMPIVSCNSQSQLRVWLGYITWLRHRNQIRVH